jgi:ribosomal protein S18 acetylase RimI-like enzyme
LTAVRAALARAFQDDPWVGFLFRDDASRPRRLTAGFDLYLRRHWLPRGACFTTDRAAGAACWMPPGAWKPSLLDRVKMLPGLARATRRDTPRLLRLFGLLEKHHPDDRPHWYLPIVGVDPAWQGRGFGSALLRPILERCDAEGTGAYLEASTPRNRALYERHGFEVTGELRLPDGTPGWPMWREPR